jgi:NOL1/NOP2/sun family putative RNA methylase
VNLLKATVPDVLEQLKAADISVQPVSWSETAFLCAPTVQEAQLQALPCYAAGEIYLQSLSSMLPPVILQPQPKQEILDMTAAPGGKTTQMAAMTGNQANIMACELHKMRAEKLKYNVEKQGAKRVNVMVTDARRLSPYFSFDRILLDAPCSGSGTLSLQTGAGVENLTAALVEKTVKAQRALLKKACALLKRGQEMVYSTCSILPVENEQQVQAVLADGKMELLPIAFDGMETLPQLPTALPETLCVCPDAQYEGFFVAKFRKR